MTGRVKDKVAFITGAASGFGRQSAVRLVEQGAKVVATDFNWEGLNETVQLVGDSIISAKLDVTNPDDWKVAINDALERFGRIDVMLNSAGNAPTPDDIEAISDDTWDAIIDCHLTGTFLGCQYAVATMKKTGGGSIINLSSVLGIRGFADSLAYCAAKGGVRLLTKSVAVHCGSQDYKIRCNSIHPGYMMTPMVTDWIDGSNEGEKILESLIAHHPIGRLGDADDIAQMVLYLASDESRYVTGAEMVVDGGYTAI
tara:strand:- start:691 stop:1458 length:768 start_codon:yes stop_codon:yes gene_type:complete